MSSYPKWLYHPTQAAVLVDDEAAHKALGAGWAESPADFKTETKAERKTEEKPVTMADLTPEEKAMEKELEALAADSKEDASKPEKKSIWPGPKKVK